MTNYHLKALIPPSLLAQQKNEERRRELEAVRKRRKINYTNYYKKLRLQAADNLL